MSYADVSPFVEAQLIFAAQEYDLDEVDRLVAEMSLSERRALADACVLLTEALRRRAA